jgi:hypothetical protein
LLRIIYFFVRRRIMNQQDERAPLFPTEPHHALTPAVAACAVEDPKALTPADRLYRIAAMTTGLALLATLL